MDDTRISLPVTSHFTIGTSPYYAHQHGLAIDVYHSLSLKNYGVMSPISGVIEKVKTLQAPKPRFVGGINKDYLTLVRNTQNSGIIYKILHVKPDVQVGDLIEVGDLIGTSIRNGYFAYWSSPHLHLEVRVLNNAIRASGGIPFLLAFKGDNQKAVFEKQHSDQIPVKIHSTHPEFTLAHLPENLYHRIMPIYGAKVNVNHVNCILDGGMPHYKNGTVLSQNRLKSGKKSLIYFNDEKIGNLHTSRDHFGFFKFNKNLKFFLNLEEILGISFYLANFKPFIKIIHKKLNQFSFKPYSSQTLLIGSE
jgi:hypothetical protein